MPRSSTLLFLVATLALPAVGCALGDSDDGDLDKRAPASCVPNAAQPAGACEPIEQDVVPFQNATGAIDVYVDGQKVDSVVAPFIKDNRTYVEMAAIFRALGADVGFESLPIGRITAVRDDLKLTMHIGYRWGSKFLRDRQASYFAMDASPFLAKRGSQSLSKIVVPASFVAAATGADVRFDGTSTPKRVDITRGRTYFFDWDGRKGTYIQYADARNQMAHGCPTGFVEEAVGRQGGRWCKSTTSNEAFLVPTATMRNACLAAGQSAAICDSGRFDADLALQWRGKALCTVGAQFDDVAQACTQGGDVLGPFPAHYRSRCSALGFTSCASNRWPIAPYLQVLDTADLSAGLGRGDAVALLKRNPELYGVPNEQNEIVSAGLYSRDGTRRGDFQRSEAALPPFVLSARRQTDQMARTAYLLLSPEVRRSTAFVFVDRLAQDPDAYVPYLAKKQRVILMGTFMGLGGVKAKDDPKHDALKIRHARELFKLRASLTLVRSMGLQVSDVLWSIGDTHPEDPALTAVYRAIQDDLQSRYGRIMDAAGLSQRKRPLSYGGDELAVVAFAQAAGPAVNAYVEYSDAGAVPRYDGGANVTQLLASKFAEAGLQLTSDPADAAIELYVLARTVGNSAPNLATLPAEAQLMARVRALPAARRAKSYIIDMRNHNGAVNADSVPPTCDYLGFSGWGTGANAIGTAVATAKLLTLNGSRAAARRLLLEAVAFDVFANGYKEAQAGELKRRIEQQLAPYALTFSHHPGYFEGSADAVYDVFATVNTFVNERMLATFGGSGCLPAGQRAPFRVTAQLWRTFEAETHLVGVDDGFNVPGLFRSNPTIPGATKPVQELLNPTRGTGAVTQVNLSTLLAE